MDVLAAHADMGVQVRVRNVGHVHRPSRRARVAATFRRRTRSRRHWARREVLAAELAVHRTDPGRGAIPRGHPAGLIGDGAGNGARVARVFVMRHQRGVRRQVAGDRHSDRPGKGCAVHAANRARRGRPRDSGSAVPGDAEGVGSRGCWRCRRRQRHRRSRSSRARRHGSTARCSRRRSRPDDDGEHTARAGEDGQALGRAVPLVTSGERDEPDDESRDAKQNTQGEREEGEENGGSREPDTYRRDTVTGGRGPLLRSLGWSLHVRHWFPPRTELTNSSHRRARR